MSVFTKRRSVKSDDWTTPKTIYDLLDSEFDFNDDPCPLMGAKNADGLLREWGTRVFMNHPYSESGPWCEKAVIESRRGKIIVGLLKGDTSTKWFHKYVLPHAEIRFIEGRLEFNEKGRAPFPSIIAIWGGNERYDL